MKKKVELLAPCGSYNAVIAAVNNGADAIYIGGTCFSARAFADNFNHEEIVKVINFCHIRNVNVYVAMNILIFENEIKNALKEIDFLYHNNVDAIIVQDLGLFNLIRKHYPDLEVHCSTQMHIHNKNAALFMKEKGVKRIVIARETPLNIIKEIVETKIDVEVFSYGALCISYSGQCLMSSILQKRSGNRGVCAQHCRLPYKLIDNDNNSVVDTFKYLLSPKDLNLLNDLNKLLDLNISSLKLEGRMKRSEYVGLSVKIFRKAIDAYYNNEKFILSKEEEAKLKLMFNRGFTRGKIFSENDDDFMNPYRPNHMGLVLGKIVNFDKNYISIKLFRDVSQNDGIRIINENEDFGMNLNKIYLNGKLVNSASKGEIIKIEKRCKVNINDEILITTDSKLINIINRQNETLFRKIPLNLKLSGKINQPLYLTVSDDKNIVTVKSDFILEKSKSQLIAEDKIIYQLSKMGDTPYILKNINLELDDVFIPIKSLNELRRLAIENLNKIKIQKYRRIGKQPYILENLKENLTYLNLVEINSIKQFNILKNEDCNLYTGNKEILEHNDINFISPTINEASLNYSYNDMIISEIGMLHNNFNVIANSSLNVTNSYALAFLLENNCRLVIYSLELSAHQIKMIEKAFYSRFNFYPNTATFIYGRRDLMITKQKIVYNNLVRKPGKINLSHHFSLQNDKKQKFPLMVDKLNFTHILENESFNYSDEIITPNLFYRFTIENKIEKNILRRKIK